MSKNQKETPTVEDSILDVFNSAKEEQLGLFDGEDTKVTKVIKNEEPKEEAAVQKEVPVKYFTGQDGIEYTEDEWHAPVVRDGPTRREVEGWKEKHGAVYFTPFDSEVFVWRRLLRPEYRTIISDSTLTALDREELFTEKCVLYPYDFSLEKIKKYSAGVSSLLSEMIMDKSGFVAQSAPIKL